MLVDDSKDFQPQQNERFRFEIERSNNSSTMQSNNQPERSLEDESVLTNLIQENEETNLATESLRIPSKAKVVGFALILGVVFLWTASSFIVQKIESDSVNALFVTFYSTSMCTILLPLGMVRDCLFPKGTKAQSVHSMNYIAMASAKILPFWYGANLLYNWSLCKTSVASSTILSSTSAAFTLIFGGLLQIETVSFFKALAVAICFIGVVFVSLGDEEGTHNLNSTVGCATESDYHGDILAVLSAMLYAMYTLSIRFNFPNDEEVRVEYLFGFIGLYSVICFVPVLFFLHFWSNIDLNVAGDTMMWLTINSLISNVLSDILWAKAVLLTSPTITTVGLSLTIPLSLVLDTLINRIKVHLLQLMGGVLITAGFVVVTLAN